MKKVFWTTIFWVAAVALLRVYARLFDTNVAQKIAGLRRTQQVIETTGDCPICPEVAMTGTSDESTGALLETSLPTKEVESGKQDEKLANIEKQLELLTKKVEEKNADLKDRSVSLPKEIRLFLGDEKTPNAVITVSGARVEMDK